MLSPEEKEKLRHFLNKKPKWDLVELLLSHVPDTDLDIWLKYFQNGGKP